MPVQPGTGSEGNQRTKGKGPAWMGTGAGRGPRKVEPLWKPSATRKADPEARQRAVRTLVAGLAAVLIAGFVYYLLTRPEPTPLVALRPAAYPLSMPPLAFADEDIELLGKVSPQNVRVMPVELSTSAAALDDFRKQLKAAGRQFNPLRRGSDAVIVHIAAHGTVNEQSEPCLVPPGGNPFDTGSWLPLAKILEAMRTEPSLHGKKKLLLLDCQRVVSCWRAGWLENRFADALAGAVQAEEDPNLYVIAAAAPGQLAWPAPELRGSVFGHFLARAFKGEGSGAASSVSLVELFRYVATHVDDYSRERRGIRQQPTMWHGQSVLSIDDAGKFVTSQGQPAKSDDFTLAYVDRWQKRRKLDDLQSSSDPLSDAKRLLGTPPAATSISDASNSSFSLYQVWQRYRQRRQPAQANGDVASALPGYVYDPVAWSSVQQRLAAIGERLLAGRQYQGPALQAEIDRLGKDLADDQQWSAQGTLPELDRLQVSRLGRAPQASAGGGENLFEAYWKTEPAKRGESLPRTAARPRLIRDIYEALSDPAQAADLRPRLATAAELLKLIPRSDMPIDLVEGHFIALLDRGLPASQPLSPAQLATALKVRQLAEQAANPADLRVHYAVEPTVNAADDKRREAEDLLYLASDARRFESLAGEATGNANNAAGYDGAIRLNQRLAEFLRLRDEVWADLPFLAEWHFVRARLGSTPAASQSPESLFQRTIELDDCIERAVRSRDEPGTLTARYESCQRAYDLLNQAWRNVRAELEAVYELPTNIEQAYRRAANIRDAELALRWPPLVGSSNQFLERYQQTLAEWSDQGWQGGQASPGGGKTAPDMDSSQSPPKSSPTDGAASALTSQEYDFLRELHRALAYQFVDPYDQHRRATDWDQKHEAHLIYRAEQSGESTWLRLKKLLDAYNEAIAKESPAWDAAQRSVTAAAKLRQWDRRVRVASPWLCSFQADLRRPNQPTPTRWLQQYDAAHFTAWQAYRVKGDFWGNGTTTSTSAPFFAQAIEQCDAALPDRMRPIQYDIPGGGLADFAEERPAALAALRAWEPIQFPRSFNVSAASGAETKIDVAIQPLADSGKELKLPPGLATLSLAAADASAMLRASFDPTGQIRRQAVRLPLTGAAPVTFTAYVERDSGGSGSANTEARLWYRGHVRAKPCPSDSSPPFVKYEFNRPRYPAPTVEVRGKDTVRGAVLFIFDCSASMRDADGRFAEAKRQLQQVLDELAADAGPGLRVGLMTYGKRTKAYGSESDEDLFYRFKSHPEKTPLLTRAGEGMKERMGGRFFESYPHPDRDVEELVRVADGTPALARAELNKLREEQCMGCTPLYYAITRAIQTGFKGLSDQTPGARQIVVISDGVNMPYDSSELGIGPTVGLQVNDSDLQSLKSTLQAQQGGVRVSVVLFARQLKRAELSQRNALDALATSFPGSFQVIGAPEPRQIASSIEASFPKTLIELRGAGASAAPQPLAFNQPQEVKDWGNDGLLRPEAERRLLRLKLPGEDRSLEQELELLGGERVVLQYSARDAQLSFDDDGLTRRGSGPAIGPRGPEGKKLLFDALDPERIGQSINKFNFRIRDEESERRFTPRPRYIWLEMKPRGSGLEAADTVIPCIDAVWKENVNLPRLQIPIDRWPDSPTARVQVWFRYNDPIALFERKIMRGESGQTLALAPDKWRVDQSGGEAGAARKITVTWQPSDVQPGIDKLLERAVWLWPPPDITRRFYAVDGSAAIHEFTYSRPDAIDRDVQLRIVDKTQFRQGAYSAECEFDVAN